MEKIVKDNKVAVLISTGYGAGWSTWFTYFDKNDNLSKQAIFDPELVQVVLNKPQDPYQIELDAWLKKLEELCQRKYPDQYTRGVGDLEVHWLPIGTQFRINEYDGYERIEIYDPDSYVTA